MKQRPWIVQVVAIVAIALIELVALLQGVDGKMLAGAMVLIGAVAGVTLPEMVKLVMKAPSGRRRRDGSH